MWWETKEEPVKLSVCITNCLASSHISMVWNQQLTITHVSYIKLYVTGVSLNMREVQFLFCGRYELSLWNDRLWIVCRNTRGWNQLFIVSSLHKEMEAQNVRHEKTSTTSALIHLIRYFIEISSNNISSWVPSIGVFSDHWHWELHPASLIPWVQTLVGMIICWDSRMYYVWSPWST